jgi:hypothetical protein
MSGNGSKLAYAMIAAVAAVLIVHQVRPAMTAVLPKDMPSDAKFTLTGYNPDNLEPRGQWVACGMDNDHATNWCRVTNQVGTVIYEGDFLPLGSTRALPAEQLEVGQYSPTIDWVRGPAEQIQVPIIPLKNGVMLVPAADALILPARWAKDPHELQVLTASMNLAKK